MKTNIHVVINTFDRLPDTIGMCGALTTLTQKSYGECRWLILMGMNETLRMAVK